MQRAPDFFIVGQPKTGTTALHATLRRHPQIFMPELKEPNYFAQELIHDPPPADLPTTLDHYLSLFASAQPGQLIGEASIFYLWSRTAARHIARLRPDARIIVILREPVSFLCSLHLQLVNTSVETEHDLRTALALEEARLERRHLPPNGHWPQLLRYAEHMSYMDQLQRYRDAFPYDQRLVLIYDDFRDDNQATLQKILHFLHVDETAALSTTNPNPSTRVRAKPLEDLLHAVSEGRGPGFGFLKAAVTTVSTQPTRRTAKHLVRQHIIRGRPRQPERALVTELRRRYKPEVEALAEYLGRDLMTLWGYNDNA